MVLATPVFFHSMNGQMKTFLDRGCPICGMVRDKEVYFIIAASGGNAVADSAADSLGIFTDCLHNTKEKGVTSATGVWDAGGAKGPPTRDRRTRLARIHRERRKK